MRKTQTWAIGLVVLCTILTATAQILWKIGMNNFQLSFSQIISNMPLLGGFGLYALGAAMLILALRGGELSVLYPFIATGFVWVSILSSIYLGESMNLFKWSGVAAIILGIAFIGRGS